MINLGKILLLLILLILPGFAQFTAKISDTRITQGDQIVLTLSSTQSGDLPILDNIGGNPVESSSRDNAVSYINGKKSGLFRVYYVFTPIKSFTVPSYEMQENGKKVHTDPIEVTVAPYNFDKDDADLVLKVTSSKKNVIVGEPFIVTLVYKQRVNMDVVDRRLTPPSGKHLWVDKDPIQSQSKNSDYEKVQLDYVFTAQKAGKLVINPANIKVGENSYKRDPWGIPRVVPRYKTVFSDDIIINAIALPEGVENVGDFTMDVEVDKEQSNEKEAVNLLISIKGEGNVADIKAFDLKLDNVLIYDEKPQHQNSLKNGIYHGELTQKFALVADRNYTIPAFSFAFYNPKTKKSTYLKSKPIAIVIKPTQTANLTKRLNIEKEQSSALREAEIVTQRSWLELLLVFITGLIAGMMITKMRSIQSAWIFSRKVRNSDEKALMQSLMPYMVQSSEAKAFVELLSENIYDNKQNEIDKKAIKKLLKELEARA